MRRVEVEEERIWGCLEVKDFVGSREDRVVGGEDEDEGRREVEEDATRRIDLVNDSMRTRVWELDCCCPCWR